MNILFLTIIDFISLKEKNIYTDLMREFYKCGHCVYAISPSEKSKMTSEELINTNQVSILKLIINDYQRTNVLKKGISILTLENQLIAGIKKYFSNITFDLVIYSTPPITFCKAVEFIKKRDGAKSYLLLKDIFPQNAVDIGMMAKAGIKGNIYNFFRNKEKLLYQVSDKIGCMSPANVDYVIRNNEYIDPKRVEVCPNAIEIMKMKVTKKHKVEIRNKYNIPLDKKVFVYGGNLGRPQGIEFMIECLKNQEQNTGVFFLIVGDGTEYNKLEKYINTNKPTNVKLLKRLPKSDYDNMVGACDVGMIFLDYRFTIPNFPSRLLSYMQAKIPVFAVTDPNTDIGQIIEKNGFGWHCYSNSVNEFSNTLNTILNEDLKKFGERGYKYLKDNYSSEKCYKIIMDSFSSTK